MRCAAITKAGQRCRLDATHGGYCYQHSPETADERRQAARRGGKSGGNGRAGVSELGALKREIRDVIVGVLEGSQDRGRAAVAIQGFNALRGVLELERRVRELDEIEARLAALERAAGEQKGGQRWGA